MVTFDWQCFLPDDTLACSGKKCRTVLGDGAEPPAVELGLRHLRSGGMAKVRSSHRFAYHVLGREPSKGTNETRVEPEQDVVFCLSILGCQSSPDAIVLSEARKASGNFLFKRGAYDKAALCYDKAIHCLDPYTSDEKVKKMLVDCGNNLAAANLKLNKLSDAMEAVVGVLTLQPNNPKALYRAGVIATLQDKFDEAKLAFSRVSRLLEDDGMVCRAQAILLVRERRYKSAKDSMERRMGESLVNGSQLKTCGKHQVYMGIDVLEKYGLKVPRIPTRIFWATGLIMGLMVAIFMPSISFGIRLRPDSYVV